MNQELPALIAAAIAIAADAERTFGHLDGEQLNWKPRADQFFHIDALPYLGTGKLDLRAAREIAAARSAEQG